MKLCIVTAIVAKGNGQGRVNYEVAQEAIERGHQVTLVASSVAPDLYEHPQVQWVSIPAKRFPSALIREAIFSYKSARWLKQHQAEFDLIKVNGAITSASSDVNAVHFVHSAWLESNVNPDRGIRNRNLHGLYHWLYSTLNTQWEAKAFRNTKVIIAVSEKVKQEIVRLGIPGESIQVVLNGVDLNEFYPGRVDRQALELPGNIPLALFAGDIRTPRKNLDTVLHALVQVPKLHLVVAAGVEKSPYPQLAEKLCVKERVHFIGYRRDIPKLMQAVDLFVFPSRYEACSLALLEAMASGLPVITAQTTGGSEIVTSDCGVVLSNPDDVQSLTEALNQLMDDPENLYQMGQAARKVAEQYSWQQQAKAYVDRFEDMVAIS
ncbi:glycosyltransferase family 4 protein [Phormidium sp. CLA17]|uniref:glycosyltransferase family 4 protein n=1 Tax=Leptolyngbya sp. Cla-17 TaxID=2803751 RepID=UPI0014931A4A|nr:glycosyltransferase family 4 protein [Leptolyngbya sp. Cla-17]MBM0741366.1 glycosyltransferase family 4 protein [Leptolyngbya sp. Cla-17]